ncbi:MAG: hypothetical protein ACI9U5_001197, partial [Colwellia sp.]
VTLNIYFLLNVNFYPQLIQVKPNQAKTYLVSLIE